jgi:predicted TIM-barrel fold metal-dependent hydrolase
VTEADPLAAFSNGSLAELAPPPLFDAHTHIGANDPDGLKQSAEELLDVLERAGAGTRAVTFPMHEPNGYPDHNDHVIDVARGSDGRLVALCRLDPRADPVGEATRCLDAGAVGIKLHPRAERFTLSEPEVRPIFALAHERRVPVLIHAGRGIPALGRDAVAFCREFPNASVILAHAAISDLAWIWREAAELPNLLFDTAWWNPADMAALFTLIPPGNILFASDAPYGQTAWAAVRDLRCTRQVGYSDQQVRSLCGEQLQRILAREEPADLGPPVGADRLSRDPLMARVGSWLTTTAMVALRGAQYDEPLAITRLACEVGDDAPQADACRAILALLDAAEREIKAAEELGHEEPGLVRRPGLRPLMAAGVLAATPDVPIPASIAAATLRP